VALASVKQNCLVLEAVGPQVDRELMLDAAGLPPSVMQQNCSRPVAEWEIDESLREDLQARVTASRQRTKGGAGRKARTTASRGDRGASAAKGKSKGGSIMCSEHGDSSAVGKGKAKGGSSESFEHEGSFAAVQAWTNRQPMAHGPNRGKGKGKGKCEGESHVSWQRNRTDPTGKTWEHVQAVANGPDGSSGKSRGKRQPWTNKGSKGSTAEEWNCAQSVAIRPGSKGKSKGGRQTWIDTGSKGYTTQSMASPGSKGKTKGERQKWMDMGSKGYATQSIASRPDRGKGTSKGGRQTWIGTRPAGCEQASSCSMHASWVSA